jgi:hypothetical protein
VLELLAESSPHVDAWARVRVGRQMGGKAGGSKGGSSRIRKMMGSSWLQERKQEVRCLDKVHGVVRM